MYHDNEGKVIYLNELGLYYSCSFIKTAIMTSLVKEVMFSTVFVCLLSVSNIVQKL